MSHTLSVTNQASSTNTRGGRASTTTIACRGIDHIATTSSGTGPITAGSPCRAYALKYSDVSPEIAQMSYKYIGAVLDRHRVNGSYGALIAVKEGDGFAPAIRFGIPGGSQLRVTQPSHIPVRVFVGDGQFHLTASDEVSEVVDFGSLGIGRISIGAEHDTKNFGSFACFLSDSNGQQYGLTAAHVLPSASSSSNTRVVSPSTCEITGCMQTIIRHTTVCPPGQRGVLVPVLEKEAQSILAKYDTIPSSTGGVEIMRAAGRPAEKVIFRGRVEGKVVFSVATEETRVLEKHNTYLLENNQPLIHIPAGDARYYTRKDIALFDVV